MRKIVPEKHAEQRAALIAAARRSFARLGFAGTSTAMVQAEAGSSTGKLFHYFPTKQALILAVIEDQNRLVSDWSADLVAGSDPLLSLDHLMDGVWQTAADPQGSCLVLEIAAEAARNAEAAALTREGDRQLAATITALARAAVERGQITPEIPLNQITHIVMAWIDGIFSRAGSDPDYLTDASLKSFQVGLRAILRQTKVIQ